MRHFLAYLIAFITLTACAHQPGETHYSSTPALPTINADGTASCPGGDIICENAAYNMNMQRIESESNAKMMNIDITSARKRLIAAKEAYKITPDATHEEAVDEADARLRTLISKRGY